MSARVKKASAWCCLMDWRCFFLAFIVSPIPRDLLFVHGPSDRPSLPGSSKDLGPKCGLVPTTPSCFDGRVMKVANTSDRYVVDIDKFTRGNLSEECAQESGLLFSSACINFLEDPGGQPNTKECLDWCMKHFNFQTGALFVCDLLFDMPVLSTCNKVNYAQVFTPAVCLQVCIAYLMASAFFAALRIYLRGNDEQLAKASFARSNCNTAVNMIVCKVKVTEGRKQKIDLLKSGFAHMLDVLTDINSIIVFFLQGQPALACSLMYFTVVGCMLSPGGDIFQSDGFVTLYDSWRCGFPTIDLLRFKATSSKMEAVASGSIIVAGVLMTRDETEYEIGNLASLAISMAFSLHSIHVAGKAKCILDKVHSDGDVENSEIAWNFDKREDWLKSDPYGQYPILFCRMVLCDFPLFCSLIVDDMVLGNFDRPVLWLGLWYFGVCCSLFIRCCSLVGWAMKRYPCVRIGEFWLGCLMIGWSWMTTIIVYWTDLSKKLGFGPGEPAVSAGTNYEVSARLCKQCLVWLICGSAMVSLPYSVWWGRQKYIYETRDQEQTRSQNPQSDEGVELPRRLL
eukprot:TRINITY_DN23307_c0_g2_i1.p1 TRINITY_DN23307_c0_g2~~TRINITY_DN23307_c0_g2_i1.p1  ORF type:complete len:567 (+),score=37.22 TRINITY_DN23307_c0_g2_i1:77-1777(+)